MKIQRHWLMSVAILLAVWTGVAIVMKATEDQISWPGKVIELIQTAPWLGDPQAAGPSRQVHLDKVIVNFNRLDFAQRREVREEAQADFDRFVESLTPDEQKQLADRLLAGQLDIVSKGLQAMKPPERKQMAERIRRDMLARNPDQAERVPSTADLQLMLDVGLESFLMDASPAEKLRLAPMLEDMQSRIQGMRR